MERALNESRQPATAQKPPIIKISVLAWIKANLFNGWFNSLLTLVTLYLLWKVVPPFIEWAFIDSLWTAAAGACQQSDGACWSVISHNFRFIIFGFYPYDQHWRPLIAMLLPDSRNEGIAHSSSIRQSQNMAEWHASWCQSKIPTELSG